MIPEAEGGGRGRKTCKGPEGTKFPVIEYINLGAIMYSMETILIILYYILESCLESKF